MKKDFSKEGLCLNFVSGIHYLGAYLGRQEEIKMWVKPQVEAWDHGFRVLSKIARRYPQSAYAGSGMPLQLEWKYLQRTFPRVGTLVGPIEEALREKLFPSLFGGGGYHSRISENPRP